MKTGLRGDGIEADMRGVSIVQGLRVVMLMGHKCACMGCLNRPCIGGEYVF